MIIKVDETTLGKKQQVVSNTRLTVRCDECGIKEWGCVQSNHALRKNDKDLCQSCKNKLGVSGMKGKSHSDKTISIFKNGDRAGDKNPSKRQDVRDKISTKLKGRTATWLTGKKRPEHAKKMSELMTKVWSYDNPYRQALIDSQVKKHSKLHDEIKLWLNKNGMIDFESEQLIDKTMFIVDELLANKKLILEINGDYWHCNPISFNKDDTVIRYGKRKKVAEIWEYENMRQKELQKLGYTIFVIWEHSFKTDKLKLINEINKFING